MSVSQINVPSHVFTSTITSEGTMKEHKDLGSSGFNAYLVILTALFFFAVLAWFNFVLALYQTLTSKKPDHEDETLNTLGFAVVWTLLAIVIYGLFMYFGVLSSSGGGLKDEHPLLKGEGRDAFGGETSDVLGQIDFGI